MNKRTFPRLRALCCLALLLLAPLLAGCAQQEVFLEDLLPRQSVTQTSVNYLNLGVGENIPRLEYTSGSAEFDQLLSLLYGAEPVLVEIPTSYSPEINASHELFLVTSGGTMTLYYDDYQNLVNVPTNRRIGEESVRVYLSFQPTGLAELLAAWGETLMETSSNEESAFVPPDDSALRAGLDLTLFDQVSSEIAFTPSSYERTGDNAIYYAFGSNEMPSLTPEQVLFVACPAAGDARQASITSISESDFYILVRVALADDGSGASTPTAALCVRADVDKGKPIVFVDEAGNVLYAQSLAAPAEETPAPAETPAAETDADPNSVAAPEASTAPTASPVASQPASTPASASGGEIGSDEPLQP